MVASLIATRTQRQWLDALEGAAVPSGPINELDAVFADHTNESVRALAADGVVGSR